MFCVVYNLHYFQLFVFVDLWVCLIQVAEQP